MDRLFYYDTKIGRLGIREDGESITHIYFREPNVDAEIEANKLVELLGGKKNIVSIDASMSRFKVILNYVSLANKEGIKKLGAKGIVEIDNQLKIVFDADAVKLKKCIEELLKQKVKI